MNLEYQNLFEGSEISNWNFALDGKTINDLVLSMQSDETYVNVHTEDHQEGGELREQILENEG